MSMLNNVSFQHIFNHLSEPIVVVQANVPYFSIVACNEAYRTVSQIGNTDIIGKRIKEVYETTADSEPGDSLVHKTLEQAIHSRQVVKLEAVRYDIPAGRTGETEECWWQAEYIPIAGENGETEFVMCATRNITEQVKNREALEKTQQQQEALQREKTLTEKLNNELEERVLSRTRALTQSEDNFKNIILQAPVAMGLFTGAEMTLQVINDRFLELWGKERSIVGKPLLEALPELKGQPYHGIMLTVMATGVPYHGNESKVMLYRNGSLEEGYYNFINHPFKDADGNNTGIIVVAMEVTLQVLANKKVKQAEELLRFALEAANIGTWYMDINSRELKLSARFKEQYGYGAGEDPSYADILAQIPEDYKADISAAIDNAIKNGEAYNIEHPVTGFHDGQFRWLKALGNLQKDDKGNHSHFSGVSIDITEQKKDDIRKNDFIAMVSHELKTPITTLKAYTQLMAAKAGKNKDTLTIDTLAKMNRQVSKMTSMINSFLNVARLDAGKISLEKKTFDLDRLISETVEEMATVIQSDDICFLSCDPVTVFADYEKIGQVINNLLSNAVKYSGKDKKIEITCRRENNTVTVSVKDEGIGIKPEHIDKLFDRFYRVESGNNRTVSGFGIGLYLSAEIVQRHNGKIWVESEENKGSTFHFSVPVA